MKIDEIERVLHLIRNWLFACGGFFGLVYREEIVLISAE